MTGLLLDTHALFWWFEGNVELSIRAREAIGDPSKTVSVSAVSLYEILNKHRIGKWPEADPIVRGWRTYFESEGFELLGVDHEHASLAGSMRWLHRDPFDRLLVAQALIEDLELVSNEELFDMMGVRRLW